MIRALLAPLAIVFGQASRLRSRLYDAHIFESFKLHKPVISVGNLTVGGTGKTPVVDAILTQLEARGLNCAVLTRGHGRESKKALVVDATSTAKNVGDEPLWLFRRHPRAQIAVGADRAKNARPLKVDVFILDDGFQHRRVRRDLEIVLVDCSRPLWQYQLLPQGYGREPLSSLSRADVIVLTRVNQADAATKAAVAQEAAKNNRARVVECSIVFEGFDGLIDGRPVDVKAKNVFIYSAIGNPQSFRRTVSESGAAVTGEGRGGDHAAISGPKISEVNVKARAALADFIILTEKDAVKWREIFFHQKMKSALPILVARTSLKFNPALPDIYDLCHHRAR